MESEHKLGGQRSLTVVSGPLAGYAAGFRQALIAQGYARRTIGDQMSMMAHLSRWLKAGGLDVKALQSAAEIDRFFAERRAGGHRTRVPAGRCRACSASSAIMKSSARRRSRRPGQPAGCWPSTGSTCATNAVPHRERSVGSPHAPRCFSSPPRRPGNSPARR